MNIVEIEDILIAKDPDTYESFLETLEELDIPYEIGVEAPYDRKVRPDSVPCQNCKFSVAGVEYIIFDSKPVRWKTSTGETGDYVRDLVWEILFSEDESKKVCYFCDRYNRKYCNKSCIEREDRIKQFDQIQNETQWVEIFELLDEALDLLTLRIDNSQKLVSLCNAIVAKAPQVPHGHLLTSIVCYGQPIWILSSATINNAKEFCEKLIGEDFVVVDKDDSPSGAKKVILWDLPYDRVSGKYRSAHQETKNLFVTHLKYKNGIQTLTFTLSRKMAELQAIWAKKALPMLKDKISSYRAGISKKKRREIEINFKNKIILGVSSTNALELGIYIGSLDATISSGFPGTISSFKQQIGRSGRGSALSVSTFIPMQNPLDLFYVHNHDQLFGNIQEEVLITLKNEYILKNHLCCASKILFFFITTQVKLKLNLKYVN